MPESRNARSMIFRYAIVFGMAFQGTLFGAGAGFSDWMEKGTAQEDKGSLAQAAVSYDAALKIDPESPEAFQGMERVCRGIIGKNPKDTKTRALYLNAARGTKDTAAFQKALEFVIRKVPADHGSRFSLAEIYLKNGDKPQAYQQIKKALAASPASKAYQEFFLRVLETDQQFKENFKRLQKMAAPKNASPEARLAYARACLLLNRKTQASKELAAVYKTDQKLLKGNREAIRMFFRGGKHDIARSLAEDYIKDHPDDFEIQEIRVKCLEADSTAKPVLRKAIEALVKLDPETKNWWLHLAELEMEEGDSKSALKHAKIWVERNPRSIKGYKFMLPLTARDSTELETYASSLEKLIELEPKRSTDRRKSLGIMKYEEGKFSEAEKLLAPSVRQFPKDAAMWYALGMSRYKLNMEKDVESALKKAWVLEPENPEYARAYGGYIRTDAGIKGNLALFKVLEKQSPSLTEQIKIAKSYTLNNDHISAAITWKKLADLDFSILRSEPLAVRSLLRGNQPSAVLTHYEELSGIFSVNIELADYMKSVDKKQDAIRYLIAAYKIKSEDVDVLLKIGSIYGELWEYSKGLDAFQNALKLRPLDKAIQKKAMDLARASGNQSYIQSMQDIIKAGDPSAKP